MANQDEEEQAYWAWLSDTRRYIEGSSSYKTHTLRVKMLSAWRAGAEYGRADKEKEQASD